MDIKRDRKAREIATGLIKEFEGLSLQAYKCPAGVKTIGWGHVITKHENTPDIIDKEMAETLLEIDLLCATSCLYRYTRSLDLNYNQAAALMSFIFNLGTGTFQCSTLRQKLNRGEYNSAANEFDRFVFAGGKKLQGLIRRREAEKQLFKTHIELDIASITTKPSFFARLTQQC